MRKVLLTMKEQYSYEIVKDYVDHHKERNFKRLCLRLGCSERTARRKIAGYKAEGKAFFSHKNHLHKPATTISESTRKSIIDIYNKDYYDANFKHFHEHLEKLHPEICPSLSTLRNIFAEVDILSPKAHKSTKRKLRKKDKLKASPITEPVMLLKTPQESTAPHPRRARSRYAGEVVYIDASPHQWFSHTPYSLHAAIDSATGTILGAWFEKEETLQGYYQLTAQILRNYGIPACFHTDGRAVFEYKKAGARSVENDTPTQFTYACRTLGIQVKPSYSAEAQGRIERLFQTLQSRLPVEFRLAGITTQEKANEYLLSNLLQSLNKKFASPVQDTMSVFEKQLSDEDINLTLAVLAHRQVDKGHSISYKNNFYRFIKPDGTQAYLKKGEKVLVIKALDESLFASCHDVLYRLELIPARMAISYDFDSSKPVTKREPVIPSMRHPWKRNRFLAYEVNRLEHVYSFPEACYTTDKFALATE